MLTIHTIGNKCSQAATEHILADACHALFKPESLDAQDTKVPRPISIRISNQRHAVPNTSPEDAQPHVICCAPFHSDHARTTITRWPHYHQPNPENPETAGCPPSGVIHSPSLLDWDLPRLPPQSQKDNHSPVSTGYRIPCIFSSLPCLSSAASVWYWHAR